MIALIPLMNLSLPPNLFTMLSYIEGPLQFNFMDKTGIGARLFGLNPESDVYPAYSDNFAQFGYDSNLTVLLVQDMIVYLLIFIIGSSLTIGLLKTKALKRFHII